MTSRILGAAGVGVGVLAGVLAGCGQVPAPGPTPTATAAFATEEEAFAAAEEVYRAYNDALNARRGSDPLADPEQYLTGEALEAYIDAQNTLASLDLRIHGDAVVSSFATEAADISPEDARLTAVACLDVSGVSLVDASGADVTPPDRGPTIAQIITFVGSKRALLIALESSTETTTC